MALVVLAENISTAGIHEIRADAQYLLTSIAKPARAKRGATCSYGFSTRAITSLSVLCGSRVSGEVRSLRRNQKSVAPHSLTCEQGRHDCGGPFKPGKCCQKAIDGVAWQVRLRIVEANLAAISGQPKREFLPPLTPSYRKTRQEKRNELLETIASMGHLIRRRWDRREIYRCARCGRAGCLQRGGLSSRRVPQSWHGTTIDGWKSPPRDPIALFQVYSDVEDPFATVVRWMPGKVTGTNGVGTTCQRSTTPTN